MKGTVLILKIVISVALILSGPGLAQAIFYSPDTTTDLSGTTLYDEDVAEDLAGNITLIDAGPIPAGTDLTAYHLLPSGDQLIAFDTTVLLSGTTFEPGDIARYNGTTYSMEFDASAEGVPSGVYVDALTMDFSNNLLMSFDTTVNLGVLTVDDEDLVVFTGSGFISFFDGSSAGINEALDLDAAHLFNNGVLRMSFDGSGVVDSVSFDDEDVLQYYITNDTWTLSYNGSEQHTGWLAADLDALFLQFLAGIPIFNEWGMILFMVLAGLGSIYYLRRQKRVS